jgi:curli biogenesis system outer membrane secretion channel CsgG
MKPTLVAFALLIGMAALSSCTAPSFRASSSAEVNTDGVPDLPDWDGKPRARVVVQELDWKPNSRSTTVRVEGPDGAQEWKWSVDERTNFGVALEGLLIDSLTNAQRFAVLDRSVLELIKSEKEVVEAGLAAPEGGAQDGGVLRPDVVVQIVVQEFEPAAKGSTLGLAAINYFLGEFLGIGAALTSTTGRVVLQLKLVDLSSTEVVLSTLVTGEASSSSITLGGGALAVGGLGGGALQQWEEQPMGAAIRLAIAQAVRELALRTPGRYFVQE